jgi:hypothetical protein
MRRATRSVRATSSLSFPNKPNLSDEEVVAADGEPRDRGLGVRIDEPVRAVEELAPAASEENNSGVTAMPQ